MSIVILPSTPNPAPYGIQLTDSFLLSSSHKNPQYGTRWPSVVHTTNVAVAAPAYLESHACAMTTKHRSV